MNEELRNIYQTYLDAPAADRIEIAKQSFGVVAHFCQEQGLSDEDGLNFILNCIRLFVSADRKCSETEYRLFLDMTGMSEDQFTVENFYEMTNGGSDPEFINALDEVIDSMDDDAKLALCQLGLAFLSSDGQLTSTEIAIFEKILAK